jgi:hypothetical protein
MRALIELRGISAGAKRGSHEAAALQDDYAQRHASPQRHWGPQLHAGAVDTAASAFS